ncbi:MAG: hypothetical protein IIZ61_01870, partial [Lachnospiraceae bacterium]|nr:hypothetical protein [Lachnospiraceae bacterium]
MKKTCLKKISVLLTTSLMIGGLCFPINGGFCVHASAPEQAQDAEEIVLRTDDYREMELIDGGTMSTYEFEERFSRKTTHSSASDQTYAKYTSDAIYNVLSTSEKQFYNRLYDLCSGYLTGTDNLSSTRADKVTYTVTSAVPYYGMTPEDAYTLAQFFSAENPQFYFLDNAVVYTSSGNKSGTVQLECFDIFKNGNTRATYTKSFFKTADNIIAA